MTLDYETVSSFSQIWGMLGFVTVFSLAIFSALRPSKRAEYEKAAMLPLEKD
jgi:cytochrome c oxidase cbb3-type subunit 4